MRLVWSAWGFGRYDMLSPPFPVAGATEKQNAKRTPAWIPHPLTLPSAPTTTHTAVGLVTVTATPPAWTPTMELELKTGLSVWAIVAIVCNSVVGVLILILFVVLYKACKVPSCQEKAAALTAPQLQQRGEQKYLLTAA